MIISIGISIIAFVVSIGGFIYTVFTNQSKFSISIFAKLNSLRVDVHEASIELLNLINNIIKVSASQGKCL